MARRRRTRTYYYWTAQIMLRDGSLETRGADYPHLYASEEEARRAMHDAWQADGLFAYDEENGRMPYRNITLHTTQA